MKSPHSISTATAILNLDPIEPLVDDRNSTITDYYAKIPLLILMDSQ
jgi:hypothetical protein